MKTLGIGVDIIENSRIKKSIKNKKFLNRIFSFNELKFLKKKLIRLILFLKDLQLKKLFLKL